MNNLAPIGVSEIAEQLRARARRTDTENMTAVVMLLAANQLDWLANRLVVLARELEQMEARQ